jgi:hypothetical protein
MIFSGIIVSIAVYICLKRGMIFWRYKLFLLTRLKEWRSVVRTYGTDKEAIEWLSYRTGAKYPILKPLGLCPICYSFWIGLVFTQSFVYACSTMVLMYFFIFIEKNFILK